MIADLVAAGAINDATNIYWDVRIPQDKPTVEFRVADVCPRLDDAVMLAGLVRAVALRCARAAADGEADPDPRPELLRAAAWRAARRRGRRRAAGRGPPARRSRRRSGSRTCSPNLPKSSTTWARARSSGSGCGRSWKAANSAARQRAAVARVGAVRAAVDLVVEEDGGAVTGRQARDDQALRVGPATFGAATGRERLSRPRARTVTLLCGRGSTGPERVS